MSAAFRRGAAVAPGQCSRTAAPAAATRVRTRRDRRVTSVLRLEGGIGRRGAPVEYLSVYGPPEQTQWFPHKSPGAVAFVGQVCCLRGAGLQPASLCRLNLHRAKQWLPWRNAPDDPVLGGGEGPLFRGGDKACLDGILFDVGDDPADLLRVEEAVVVGLVLPEGAVPAQQPVARPGGIALDAVHNPFPRRPGIDGRSERGNPGPQRPEQPVEVARHDNKGEQVVADPGKVVQGVNDGCCKAGVAELTRRGMAIQPLLRTGEG